MAIDIRLLGRFTARRGGHEIPPSEFGGRLARTLLRVLATRRGRFVALDVLADALWPTRLPADPGANVRVLVNRVRRALAEPALILTDAGGYSLVDDDRCRIDAEQFTAKVEAGRVRLSSGQADAALPEFRSALDLWGEPLEEDAYDDWAQEYRSRLHRVYQQALEGAAAAALSLGDTAQAVALAESAVAREALREPAYLLLMRAHAAAGDAAAALATFGTLRCRLCDELGLDPSPEAFELEGRILRREPMTRPVRQPGRASRTPVAQELAFVGREEELHLILQLSEAALAGPLLVSGGAGTGKSRLLHEAGGRSRSAAVAGRAFVPEREEPWGLARPLLRDILDVAPDALAAIPDRAAQALADIVPELEERRPISAQPLDPETRRALAVEGAVRLLSVALSEGVLVLVDDLQWSDPTSLVVLTQMLRRTPAAAVVLAYRPEDMSPPVAEFLEQLEAIRPGLRRMQLGSLLPSAIGNLFGDSGLIETVVGETDLTPFAVAEVVRALAAQSLVEPDVDGRWRLRSPEGSTAARSIARAGQRKTISARVRQQPAHRRQLLSLLALLGRETPARVLTAATGAAQACTLGDLEALTRAGLVRLGDEGWAPAHDMISATVSGDLGGPERVRLHELLAQALEAEGAEASLVARQLEGAGDREAAAKLFAEAAGLRLSRFETDEAQRLADAGLRLRCAPAASSHLLELRAEARARKGDVPGARDDLRAALASTPSGPERSRILARLAKLTGAAEGFEGAARLVDVALAEAGSDRGARAHALAVGAFVDLNMNRLDRAEARSTDALALFQEIDDPRGGLEIVDFRASFALISGRLQEYVTAADHAVPLFNDVGDFLRAASLQGYRGLALAWMGRNSEGLADIERSLQLVRGLPDPEGEARCLWLRAETLVTMGRLEDARDSAEAAVGIARELGYRGTLGMALGGLGLAKEMLGDLDGAEAALREALEQGRDVPLVSAAGAARLASVLAARGKWDAVASYISEGLSGVPLVAVEAGLIHARLALARGEPQAADLVAAALARAEALGARATPAYIRLKGVAGDAPASQPAGPGR